MNRRGREGTETVGLCRLALNGPELLTWGVEPGGSPSCPVHLPVSFKVRSRSTDLRALWPRLRSRLSGAYTLSRTVSVRSRALSPSSPGASLLPSSTRDRWTVHSLYFSPPLSFSTLIADLLPPDVHFTMYVHTSLFPMPPLTPPQRSEHVDILGFPHHPPLVPHDRTPSVSSPSPSPFVRFPSGSP